MLQVTFQTPSPLEKAVPSRPSDAANPEEENWRERTAVITKDDHNDYVADAKDIVSDIVEALPIATTPQKNSATSR